MSDDSIKAYIMLFFGGVAIEFVAGILAYFTGADNEKIKGILLVIAYVLVAIIIILIFADMAIKKYKGSKKNTKAADYCNSTSDKRSDQYLPSNSNSINDAKLDYVMNYYYKFESSKGSVFETVYHCKREEVRDAIIIIATYLGKNIQSCTKEDYKKMSSIYSYLVRNIETRKKDDWYEMMKDIDYPNMVLLDPTQASERAEELYNTYNSIIPSKEVAQKMIFAYTYGDL